MDQSEIMTEDTSSPLRDYLDIVRSRIIAEALKVATSQKRTKIEPKDIAEATKRFGQEIDSVNKEGDFTERVFSSISAITIVSALLAIIFGFLGVYRGGQGAFDIAKIFAGAVVGSTGVAVRSAIKRR